MEFLDQGQMLVEFVRRVEADDDGEKGLCLRSFHSAIATRAFDSPPAM